jgi:succinate dehydrogenase / fumarate reductase, cytochrome b subunit
MSNSPILKSSIAKKIAMALSGLFLVSFLSIHFIINLTSVFSEDLFNTLAHFMGNNPLIQFAMQPILILGVLFHFIMGFILDFKNRASRPIGYAKYNGSANASWPSRNMIISGIVVLSFLGLHFYDFWIPEIVYKYVEAKPIATERYFHELAEKFNSPIRTAIYCMSFFFLFLHLWHGFNSSFQSVGMNNKYSKTLHKVGYAFAVIVPFGFIFIALFHHFNH